MDALSKKEMKASQTEGLNFILLLIERDKYKAENAVLRRALETAARGGEGCVSGEGESFNYKLCGLIEEGESDEEEAAACTKCQIETLIRRARAEIEAERAEKGGGE
jgi:hypothetical protein